MASTTTAGGEMSFLDHLDELRSRLIRILIAVSIFFVVGWAFSDRILKILTVPVTEALENQRKAQAVQLASENVVPTIADVAPGTTVRYAFRFPVRVAGVDVPAGASVSARIDRDANDRPVVVLLEPLVVGDRIVPTDTTIPVAIAAGEGYVPPESRLVQETVQGAFNLYVKIAFYTAFALAIPFILFQIWGFVAPGLYPHERKWVWPFVGLTTVCFVLGVVFAYKIAFPAACDYLINVGGDNFRPLINADEYLDLILFIMMGLGVVFQIPTATLLLSRLGLVTAGMLLRAWRFAVIIIFVTAAVLSPTADIPNMLVFAAPMIALYVISIGIAKVFYRKRLTEEEHLAEIDG